MIRFISPAQLRRLGIIGMNRRNVGYVGRCNPRKNYPLVDNKLKTKAAAQRMAIPVPALYGVIDHQYQVNRIDSLLESLAGFVIKPVQGSGGKGILVVSGRREGSFVQPSGRSIAVEEVRRHLSNILAGLHSLGGRNDCAMIEALIDFAPYFRDYSHQGVPDIRVIVYRGVPVMAMLRCATSASGGKANLHQGAVGIGIDIGSGRSICAVQHNRIIERHPDTGAAFDRLVVPHWPEILDLAGRCADMSGLGYLGADIVLDRQRGPMLLELNARPGLAIQVANRTGLQHRLLEADRINRETNDHGEKLRLARQRFAVASEVADSSKDRGISAEAKVLVNCG
ncbi:alpha-L-glutamate ligase-related protein [Thioflavicoccus mobilis 8321]|uniref:Alpha-L-glutamate ligase-related protein n=1 Tax=Thioflavicoccus mobilis 8321 TaxID=765912 RepID=L0GYA9_9GAMM|nr:alpha-L-glutamate ligase-like protein [Thioflavicoccus mobilis]AGA90365.1 alpha-L-glutamate ligase-related protein [Thioflavicoccus mobilis 8321]